MVTIPSSLFLFSLYALKVAAAPDNSLAFAAPPNVTNGASNVVRHDFASFSWPAHFFADFAGNASHPNLFTKDILDLLAKKSGAQPFIRIGGTSADRVWYNKSQALALVNDYSGNPVTAALGIASQVNIGPAFFDSFRTFPDTPWSWQINMGKDYGQPGAKENAMEVARLIVNAVQGRLESFEIGNEPDLMFRVGDRPANYTLTDYVREWNEYADAATEQVLKGNKYGLQGPRFFQGGTLAGINKTWTIQKLLDLGLDKGQHLCSISGHHYDDNSAGPWFSLGKSFMNHTTIASNVSFLKPDVEAARLHNPQVPYVLGETNSDANNLNITQYIGVFGSALWQVDRIFTSMAANMKRSNFIQGTTFGYTGFVPVRRDGRDPYVRPPLYAHILTADALGHLPDVQVYPLPNSVEDFSTHAIYSAGQLAKYVTINLDEWNSTTTYPRPMQRVHLAVPKSIKEVQVERLTASGASADEGVQWAGLSWNYTDGRLAQKGVHRVEKVSAKMGIVSLDVASTEAALITLCN
ncbi:hypothetical protein BP5796_12032 [Coleophoma crateriformis]|uniref:Beta-glucuronidase C-terminal domain-containing protein n=1 Tax=Coleophoma crateriformis TaxID=565419 RepID=A0A3D8QBX1_9HELO|nr:hypothetical protein BP5796_12032 [Coleophoma crateriformis]